MGSQKHQGLCLHVRLIPEHVHKVYILVKWHHRKAARLVYAYNTNGRTHAQSVHTCDMGSQRSTGACVHILHQYQTTSTKGILVTWDHREAARLVYTYNINTRTHEHKVYIPVTWDHREVPGPVYWN